MLKHLRALMGRPPKKQPDPGLMMDVFRKKYTDFKALLESNADLLKIISDMEEKLSGFRVFGMSYIRSETARTIFHAVRMIRSFESLCGRPYPGLMETLNHIQTVINNELELKNIPRMIDMVLPYSRVTRNMVDFIGGKNANLGEVHNRVHLRIPKGFAITTTAFDELIEFNDLMDDIRSLKMALDPENPETSITVGENIQRLLMAADVPPVLEKAILEAYAKEISPDELTNVALRSSAIGEDSELSYAGQYHSALNVPGKDIISKYKEVVASLFAPSAISYRLQMGIPFEEAAMSVACHEMIQAKAAGVMYTRHPYDASKNHILISATWGLGKPVVDGAGTPDTYELSKTSPAQLLKSVISSKSVSIAANSEGNLIEMPVEEKLQKVPCLTDQQIATLADHGMKLERHFQTPQDIEWAIDQQGEIVILQTRPLTMKEKSIAPAPTQQVEGIPILLEGGDTACPGVGYGPAHLVRSLEDLISFPEGGVLVAANSSPQFVIVMQKARAVITDFGSIVGHMASLVREFRVPTVLNTQSATSVISQGMPITVDAYSGRVYSGKVEALLNMNVQAAPLMKDTPVYQTLEKLSRHIIPLNLIDPKSRMFTPENCRTVHDLMRLMHERSYGEVFHISDYTTSRGKIAVRLDTSLPVDLHIIDMGGGLDSPGSRSKITVEQVISRPLKALLEGMLHTSLKPSEPRPINVGGFFSVLSQQMMAPPRQSVERFGDPSYAIVSDKYLNFSSRVGYHYSILDTYCGNTATKNYINFQFKGGAADDVRRNRRARTISNILKTLGFLVEVQGDRVTARLGKQNADLVSEKLDLLGRLIIYTRQMDMLMNSEAMVDRLSDDFLNGVYDLSTTGER
jgi:pyruvate, water dikinase